MLICDKRRPRTRGDTNIRPPKGAVNPPGLRPRLGRSLAWGGTPRPPGLRPLARLRAPGPCCLGSPSRRVRARVRRWRGWATACGCPCPTPSPWRFSGFGGNSKKVGSAKRCGGFGGVPPLSRDGEPGPGGGQPGCSRRLCPPSTDWARLSTGDRVQRRSGSSEQSNRANIFSFAQPTRKSRASIGFKENHCIKK